MLVGSSRNQSSSARSGCCGPHDRPSAPARHATGSCCSALTSCPARVAGRVAVQDRGPRRRRYDPLSDPARRSAMSAGGEAKRLLERLLSVLLGLVDAVAGQVEVGGPGDAGEPLRMGVTERDGALQRIGVRARPRGNVFSRCGALARSCADLVKLVQGRGSSNIRPGPALRPCPSASPGSRPDRATGMLDGMSVDLRSGSGVPPSGMGSAPEPLLAGESALRARARRARCSSTSSRIVLRRLIRSWGEGRRTARSCSPVVNGGHHVDRRQREALERRTLVRVRARRSRPMHGRWLTERFWLERRDSYPWMVSSS